MKNKKILRSLIIILIISISLIGCDVIDHDKDYSENHLVIHLIDVGQGDSSLITFPNKEVALIDAGSKSQRENLIKYLLDLNIEKIDYLIGTHPHEDHIGALPEIIRTFEIGKIYLPNKTNNTLIFEELLNEIKNKNLKITEGKAGLNIIKNGDLKFNIIGPTKDYSGINNSSIVTKIKYKNFTAIITGDAEKESEIDILEEGYNLKANLLRVGHHGSNTSTTKEFLEKVNPEYAVISVGKDNSYGHPDKEVIESLNERNIEILRTDKLGTIIFQTDGKKMKIVN